MADKKEKKQVETTGHEWDGIKEYNNPLPKWWVWCFIASIIFAIGYCIYYPSIPLINHSTKGIAGWTQYGQLDEELEELKSIRFEHNSQIERKTIKMIMDDENLRQFAEAGGEAAFKLSCSQCHGAGGQGALGFPNLLDDEWLWGASTSDIEQTIRHGVRYSLDDETRISDMMAFGKDDLIERKDIKDVVQYIKILNGKITNTTKSSDNGKKVFADNCASCHGKSGQGDKEFGAPALNNQIWLYGGDDTSIYNSIYFGRAGVMPSFDGQLDDLTIKKLVIYIHSLGGAEVK